MIILLTTITLSSCKPKAYVENIKDPIKISKKINTYNDIAKFIAGVPVSKSSKLHPYTQLIKYMKYKSKMEKSWKSFTTINISNMLKWRKKQLPKNYNKTIFYPFSGPDILHGTVFYPNGTDFIMFGLEPTGPIPNPLALPTKKILHHLKGLPIALNFILRHNFFVTKDMQKEIGATNYSSITGVLMFFLARRGYTIHDIKSITIEKGKLLNKKTTRLQVKKFKTIIPGVEIIFSTNNDDYRRLRYFSLDIANNSKQVDNFISYVSLYPQTSTIIKSASYLMHLKMFSKIRNVILQKSNYILQDDSGIPYRFFKNKNNWKVSYHGKYHKPITPFKYFLQKDLKNAISKHTTGKLPFRYGYGYGYKTITYHVIFATKHNSNKQLNDSNKK